MRSLLEGSCHRVNAGFSAGRANHFFPSWRKNVKRLLIISMVNDQNTANKHPEISVEKQKLLSRIKRLGGQITAVERSITEGDECADILMLLATIRGGVNSLMAEILEDHIQLHLIASGPRTADAAGIDRRSDWPGPRVPQVRVMTDSRKVGLRRRPST